jgi:putative exporter of polyketide antibiotics
MSLGLMVHRRWPTPTETAGMALLLCGVVFAIRIFTRGAQAQAEFALA